jgi:hypothetical protein
MRKKITPILSLAGLLAFANTHAQETVYSDPVGVVTMDLAAGTHLISFPFQKEKVLQTTVSEVSGASVTLSDSATIEGPHFLHVLSGEAAGKFSTILSSIEESLQIESEILGLQEGDSVSIRGHHTINDLTAFLGGSVNDSTTVTFYNADGSVTSLEAFDGLWYDSDFNTPEQIVFPAEGVAVTLPSATSISYFGSVSVEPIDIQFAPGLTLVSTINPVENNASTLGNVLGVLPDSSTVTFYDQTGSLGVESNFEVFSGDWYDPDFNLSNDLSIVSPNVAAVIVGEQVSVTIPPAYNN